jgi:hypothetical protein
LWGGHLMILELLLLLLLVLVPLRKEILGI